MKFQKLYDQNKNGKTKWWQIETVDNKIIVRYGLIGGQTNVKEKIIHKGKNIGKKNETTPSEQAILEATSKHKYQMDKGYQLSKAQVGSNITYLPMLANTFYPSWHEKVRSGKRKPTKVPSNASAHRKLNGVRCVVVKTNGTIKLLSRKGKDYTLICWDLARRLCSVMRDGDIWDGELYVHGWKFERILSAVKKECLDTYKLEFWVFDIPSYKAPWSSRLKHIIFLNTWHKHTWLKFLWETYKVKNEADIKKYHDKFKKEGYEGVIIRDLDAKYLWKHRGAELLKYKEFVDDEFIIVGYKSGVGTDEGAIVWICHVDNKRTRCLPRGHKRSGYFDVRPEGEIDVRRAMYKSGWRHIGAMLTVRYQERTVYNMPQFPVGVAIRDYE